MLSPRLDASLVLSVQPGERFGQIGRVLYTPNLRRVLAGLNLDVAPSWLTAGPSDITETTSFTHLDGTDTTTLRAHKNLQCKNNPFSCGTNGGTIVLWKIHEKYHKAAIIRMSSLSAGVMQELRTPRESHNSWQFPTLSDWA